jgi:transposase
VGQTQTLHIRERGNKYLRKLLIHGLPAALPDIAERDTDSRPMDEGIARARPPHVVALASKLARIVWAGRRRGENFAARRLVPAA